MQLISAILLAAGESRRMGQPKLLLPWGKTTVLGQVVATFAAGLSTDSKTDDEILVVTGGASQQVEEQVAELAKKYPVRAVYNPKYARGGMLSSIQVGLAALTLPPPSLRDTSPKSLGFGGGRVGAALIGLGDQPQVREETVRRVCAAFVQTESPLVIPRFENRRGHPWLASRSLWPEILALPPSATPRQFLNNYAGQVSYVAADESILQDLDTVEDYNRQRP
jgi:molybdenum cofactor cytidylyltransferase